MRNNNVSRNRYGMFVLGFAALMFGGLMLVVGFATKNRIEERRQFIAEIGIEQQAYEAELEHLEKQEAELPEVFTIGSIICVGGVASFGIGGLQLKKLKKREEEVTSFDV